MKSPDLDQMLPKVQFSLDQFSLEGKKEILRTGTVLENGITTTFFSQHLLLQKILKEIAALNLQGSTEDKVRSLYQYMQNKTRYIAVAIGIGGWQPMPADDVRKKLW